MKPPLVLADRGVRPHLLVAGRGAGAVLGARGLPQPGLFRFHPLGAEGFVARVAPRQFLVAGAEPDSGLAEAGSQESLLVLRHDCAELVLAGGAPVERVLAELCACDLAQFAADAYIPTLFAGVEVALLRATAEPGMVIVCAPADAPYLRETLTGIVNELGGAVRGAGQQSTTEQGDS